MGDPFLEEASVSDRMAMGVLDDGGDSTHRRGARPRDKILPARIPRILEVNVAVDHPRKDKEPGSVNALTRLDPFGCQSGDSLVFDIEIRPALPAPADDDSTF